MLTYITAFIFYTLAMIGVLLLGFVIYKKTIMPIKQENKGMIKVIDKVAISPKKSLLVVRVKNEKFLIAMDAERTTFLSKLTDEKMLKEQKEEKITEQKPSYNKNYVDDIQQQRLDRIQRQFKQLYSNNQEDIKTEQNPDRKEMIRRLLKDLNDTTGSVKTGSY
ncbi:MAG: flagellar biosynthetic protein FliO [Candidatus Gastranaerophilales bacterium]|nr:flagellar biosynthetic protein FliO [Candidatus Gastranaerophilales bacterium]